MAISLKELRKKIKSISSTKKITQAMQMVAASKMQKSINHTQLLRAYSSLAWEIIKNISLDSDITHHPLLSKPRQEKNMLLILITSNKGLCGSLNAQIIRKISGYIKDKQTQNIKTSIITMGNKGKNFISRHFKDDLIADFPMPDRLVEFSDITPLSKIIFDEYKHKKYDRICIFYNQFISSLRQQPIRRQILPIPNADELEEYQLGQSSRSEAISHKTEENLKLEYKFEPNINEVLDLMLPKIIQSQLFQILLEAAASEHSARMVAMKNATDNAQDLIYDLQLTYNSMRQAAITQELSEITAGAEALHA